MSRRVWRGTILCGTLAAAWLLGGAAEASEIPTSRGQTVYVPIYSHVYRGDKEQQFPLAATISIRNTDPAQPITILSVDYHDSEGRLLQQYLMSPLRLAPLASTRYVVKETDMSGGSGAKCLVRWKAASPASLPVIEAVMIGTRAQQGISFTVRGVAVRAESD
jgi:hypothetical protein